MGSDGEHGGVRCPGGMRYSGWGPEELTAAGELVDLDGGEKGRYPYA